MTAEKGNTTSQTKAEDLINEGLGGGQYATINRETGEVTINATEEQISNFTEEQKGFYDTLNGAITADGDVTIGLVESSPDVLIGSHRDEKIDVDDVNAFGTSNASDKFSAFAHEVDEEKSKQLSGDNSTRARDHDIGIKTEEKITGYKRGGRADSTSTTLNADHTYSGNADTYYAKGSNKIKVSVNIDHNNVTGVTRTDEN